MKKIYLLLFLLSTQYSLLSTLQAQPTLKWQKSYGGSNQDHAYSIKCTPNGSYYYVFGTTASNDGDVAGNHGLDDIWLLKIDTLDSVIWKKTYGGSNGDDAGSMDITKDGGCVMASWSGSTDGDATNSGNHGNGDYWVVKVDGSGAIQWQKCYGSSNFERSYNIKATPDGGYIIVGISDGSGGDITTANKGKYDIWIVKIDSMGKLLWQKSFGGSGDDFAYGVCVLANGDYAVVGSTGSNDGDFPLHHGIVGIYDAFAIVLDTTGHTKWIKTYGGSDLEEAEAAIPMADGGFTFTGYTQSVNGDNKNVGTHIDTTAGYEDVWVVRVDAMGRIVQNHCYGGSNSDRGYDLVEDMDKGFLTVGYTYSNDGDVSGFHGGPNPDMWVFKIDSMGVLKWQKCYGSNNTGDYELAKSVLMKKTGEYTIAGWSDGNGGDVTNNHGSIDYWVLDVQCPFPVVPSFTQSHTTLTSSSTKGNQWYKDGKPLVGDTLQTYNTNGIGGSYKVAVSNVCGMMFSNASTIAGISELANDNQQIKLWPNPLTEGILHLDYTAHFEQIEIYNMLGQTVLKGKPVPTLDISGLSKGIYTLIAIDKQNRSINKIVIQ